ncbi:MAG: serine/threonine-protein kinase [Planctomycetota bacterium]|jgi:serine/threonine protein kinase
MTADDAFEPELDGFPTQVDPRHVRSREQLEVLASEFADKSRAGLRPSIDDYVRRYPLLEDQIRELFPMVAALEQWKSDRESELLRNQLPDNFSIDQLGDCRIVREIGRGGMGVVFEARQGSFERRVAVKLLPWRISMVPQRWERFQQEARTFAKLRHANIVPVFSFGRHDDFAYYVMQYVEGVSLSRVIAELRDHSTVSFSSLISAESGSTVPADSATTPAANRGLKRDSWKQFARIATQVAQALRQAHRQGVLHNDVKPANLLIDASARVWVTDFGLAEELDSDNTDADTVTGTLRYMPPERFEGKADETSDIYSLGVTLFELVTREPAFDASDRSELLTEIAAGNLRRPRDINPEIPAALEAIILKSTARQADERYLTAGDLASDLLRFINGEKVRAKVQRKWLPGFRRKP